MYSINLNNSEDSKKIKQNSAVSRLQFLPAKIQYNGKVNVENNFNVYLKEENGYISNALRGHLLHGRTSKVPQNFRGIVLNGINSSHEKKNVEALVKCTFDEFTLWDYDTSRGNSDACTAITNITDLSFALHAPLEEKNMENFPKD